MSWALDLSPMTMTGESASISTEVEASAVGWWLEVVAADKGESDVLAIARRVAFETEEWIPPQRPLSEETTMKSFRGVGLSLAAFAKTSTLEVC
jgi:hypothetical protein